MAGKESIRLTVAGNVRRYRKERGLTQERLAERAEISNTYIANIECGKTWVSDRTLEKISDALGVEAYLFFVPQKSGESAAEAPREILLPLRKIDDIKSRICAHIQTLFDDEVRHALAERSGDRAQKQFPKEAGRN